MTNDEEGTYFQFFPRKVNLNNFTFTGVENSIKNTKQF